MKFLALMLLVPTLALAFSATKKDDSVWIARSDGARQCEKGSGVSLEAGAAELKNAGVEVLESRKGNDGMIHAAVCGGAAGTTNEYKVAAGSVGAATGLGYKEKAQSPK